jgi:pimeloyl-ACP methyl ester carboxylesterase
MSGTVSGQVSPTTLAGFQAIATNGPADRPPLLFVHGSFAGHAPFADWMAALADAGWRGIAVGRRGGSPERVASLRIADYVDDTLKAIDALGEAPIIVGHSLGGLIAQKIAELGRCRAAVLLAPAPSGMLTAQRVALPAFLTMMPKILTGRPLLPGANACATITLNRMPKAERPRIHGSLVHESGKVFREMVFGTYRVDASRVRCPMLVVGGKEDRIVSVALMRNTAKRCGAELKLYDGHGHWLLEEPGWETIASDVAAWLDPAVPRNVTPLRECA